MEEVVTMYVEKPGDVVLIIEDVPCKRCVQ